MASPVWDIVVPPVWDIAVPPSPSPAWDIAGLARMRVAAAAAAVVAEARSL